MKHSLINLALICNYLKDARSFEFLHIEMRHGYCACCNEESFMYVFVLFGLGIKIDINL